MEDNCRALCTISSIGLRTAVEPHSCAHAVRPKYLTRKYCGSINLNCDDKTGESSYLVCLILIRIASGVNGAGELSISFECIKFKFLKSRLRLEIPLEFGEL
jgi:hypothetical protein